MSTIATSYLLDKINKRIRPEDEPPMWPFLIIVAAVILFCIFGK